MMRFRLAPACLVLLVACSSNPEPAATPTPTPQAAMPVMTPAATGAFDGVGEYNFTVEVMGQTQSGTLSVVKGADGKLGGKLSGPEGEPPLPLSAVALTGNKLTFGATIPNGPEIAFVLNFDGADKFAGTIEIPGMAQGTISGTRKKG